MAIIGTFKLNSDGTYTGDISTLTIQRKVRLLPTEATGHTAPELRLIAGKCEIGVAWRKTSRAGDSYFAVKLDDPTFTQPLWANLVESKQEAAVYNLLWDRPDPSKAGS
jgi:uncharacterized protein (DUF736 family)